MKKIAIIGFGFCGRLAFFHLAKKAEKNVEILIFDKDGQSSLGPAFSSFCSDYILNVPVAKMSAFSSDQKSFLRFLEKNFPEIFQQIGEDGYAPRHIYGLYLNEITKEAFELAKKNGVKFRFIAQEVVAIRGEFEIETKNQERFQANEIMLATSFKQSDLPYEFAAKNFVKKLWSAEAKEFHQKKFTNEKILLIGSGLSAVDVIVGLAKKNFDGEIFVLSRRGNFPQKHFEKPIAPPAIFSLDKARAGLVSLCLEVRQFLQKNAQCDLRFAIDSLRGITAKIWREFDEKNRRKFLRLLPYWNIFRHRAPIASIKIIEQMILSQQIRIKTRFNKDEFEKINFDYVVNCLGFELRAEKYPLLAQMVENDLLKQDFFLVASNHPKIHLLGGLNLGRDFECSAVPDLRVTVESLF